MKELSQEDWKKQYENDENSFLLDVLTDEEYDEKHIPNSTQLYIFQAQKFMEEVNEFDKSKNYYVYCRSGKRSAQACQILDQAGVANTYNLQGGIMEWKGETNSN